MGHLVFGQIKAGVTPIQLADNGIELVNAPTSSLVRSLVLRVLPEFREVALGSRARSRLHTLDCSLDTQATQDQPEQARLVQLWSAGSAGSASLDGGGVGVEGVVLGVGVFGGVAGGDG